MKRIILATSNPHKLEEINSINKSSDIIFDVVKGDFTPEETGKTFTENAIIKAQEASRIMKTYCLADDSGLCVDILNGRPGIYSARYAPTQKEKIEKLLNELKQVPNEKRQAHFTCAMVLVNAQGDIIRTQEGRVDGYIANEARGTNGFGFDPVFYLPKYDKTVAQLPEEIKNTISHRANALIPMIKWIENNI